MPLFRLGGVALICAVLCACAQTRPRDDSHQCDTEENKAFQPAQLQRVHVGMPKSELIALLGEAEYSPIEGQYYFALQGGNCRSMATGEPVECTLVAEFRDLRATEPSVTDTLQSCFWGGVSE